MKGKSKKFKQVKSKGQPIKPKRVKVETDEELDEVLSEETSKPKRKAKKSKPKKSK